MVTMVASLLHTLTDTSSVGIELGNERNIAGFHFFVVVVV